MLVAKMKFAKDTLEKHVPMFGLELVTTWVSILDQDIMISEPMKQNG